MRKQVETQKERTQETSKQQNSMHYLPRGGGGGGLRTIGGGTSHKVNGIAIQARQYGPDLPPVQETPQLRSPNKNV